MGFGIYFCVGNIGKHPKSSIEVKLTQVKKFYLNNQNLLEHQIVT